MDFRLFHKPGGGISVFQADLKINREMVQYMINGIVKDKR